MSAELTVLRSAGSTVSGKGVPQARAPVCTRVALRSLATLAILVVACASTASAVTLRVGIYQNEPKISRDEEGRPSGFFPGLLDVIARRNGWELAYVDCQWAECLDLLSRGELDVMPDVALIPERVGRFKFLEPPVLRSWSHVYNRPDITIEGILDLEGRTIAVIDGGGQVAEVKETLESFGVAFTSYPESNFNAVFAAVRDGRADAAVANRFFGNYHQEEYGLKRSGIVFAGSNLHFAFPLSIDDRLFEAFRVATVELLDGQGSIYSELVTRWVSIDPPAPLPQWVVVSAGGVGVVLLLAALSVSLMRRVIRTRTAEIESVSRRLRLATESAGIGIWEWNITTGTLVWDRIMFDLYGVRPESFIPSYESWNSLLHPNDRGPQGALAEQALANKTQYDTVFTVDRPDGEQRQLRAIAQVLRNKAGEAIGMIGVNWDHTRELQLEGELRQSQKMQAIGDLTGGVAHDFNNLLGVVLGNAELLLDRVDAPADREMLETIVQTARRGGRLTAQLLAFSRRSQLRPETVDINDVVGGVHDLLRRTLPETIEIELRLTPELWPTSADRTQFENALLNLAINARDAMPGGGLLTITTSNEEPETSRIGVDGQAIGPGRHVLVAVSDSGTGMSPNVMAKAFEPYFTTKDVGKGSGLGLAMVYGFIKQSGGSVTLSSELGVGTVIKLHLPASAVSDASGTGRSLGSLPAELPGSRGGECVLIVEDDKDLRSLLQQQLRALGYDTRAVATGQDALAALAGTVEIGLVISDVVLPGGLSGLDLADEVRSRCRGVRVILMSGYAGGTMIKDADLQPDREILTKPISIGQLARTVRATLDA